MSSTDFGESGPTSSGTAPIATAVTLHRDTYTARKNVVGVSNAAGIADSPLQDHRLP
jgi:hypothetical protein